MPETYDAMLMRVRQMSWDGPAWDLSPNDCAALAAVLERLDECESRISTIHCAFCGHAEPKPSGDPAEAMAAHIATCVAHPMRVAVGQLQVAQAEVARLEAEAKALRTDNGEFLRLSRAIIAAEIMSDDSMFRALHDLNEHVEGRGWADVPEPVAKGLVERAEAAEAEVERLKTALEAANRRWLPLREPRWEDEERADTSVEAMQAEMDQRLPGPDAGKETAHDG